MISYRAPSPPTYRKSPSPQPMSPGRGAKKVQNYLIYMNQQLGKGNFSTVYRGSSIITNEQVAIKVIVLSSLKNATLVNLLRSEIEILRTLNHPNILKCFDIITSANNCYIVTELCNEGDLQTKVMSTRGLMEEPDCRKIISDIYQGLKYLGQQHIIHRDLKVANVFMKNGIAKIADFGFAKRAVDRFRDINVGSPVYMPPQALLHTTYGPKTDVWAFGVLMFEMLHGDPPLGFCRVQQDLKAHIMQPIQLRQFKPTVPEDLKDLIIRCLDIDYNRRIGIFQIESHRYMQRIMMELGIPRTNNRPSSNPGVRDQSISNQTIQRSNSAQGNQLRILPPARFVVPPRDPSSDSSRRIRGGPMPYNPQGQSNLVIGARSNYHMMPPQQPAQSFPITPQNMRPDSRSPSPTVQRFTIPIMQLPTVQTPTMQTPPMMPSMSNIMEPGQPNSQRIINMNSNSFLTTNPMLDMKRYPASQNQLPSPPYQNQQVKQQILASHSSSTTNMPQPSPLNFQQSLHLLHYCRLIYKIVTMMNKNIRVASLRLTDYMVNWLFLMMDELEAKSQPSYPNQKMNKFRNVLRQYQERYSRELRRNQSVQCNISLVRSVVERILQLLDGKILSQPEYDQQELIILGRYLCFFLEVNTTIRRALDTGDYNSITNCNIDGFLNVPLENINMASYVSARGSALGRNNF